MNKYLRWGGMAVLTPLLLFAILSFLFYFPPFQRWAVGHVTSYASEKMGMQISVGHVRLAFPFDLSLERVQVLQANDSLPQVTDTVAHIGRVVSDIQLWPLLRRQVMIDQLSFDDLQVNTANLIHEARIKGRIGHLDLKAHGIDLGREHVRVQQALLADAKIDIALSDTVPEDTSASKNFWKINLDRLHVKHTDFALHMPGDSMSVHTYMDDMTAQTAYLDLYAGAYKVGHLDWRDGRLDYDRRYEPRVKGIDYAHLSLNNLFLRADSFSYAHSNLSVRVHSGSFRERSGLAVDRLNGRFVMDSLQLHLPALQLHTLAGTSVHVDYRMDMDAFDADHPGRFSAVVRGQVSKRDLMILLGENMPPTLVKHWPNQPLVAVGRVHGNMQRMDLRGLHLSIPHVVKLDADGFVAHLDTPRKLQADVDVKMNGERLDFLSAMLDPSLARTVRIARGIGFEGRVKVDGSSYESRFVATQGGGSIRGTASVDADRMTYKARLSARSFPLAHFLPRWPLAPFTGTLEANGVGTDLMSPATRLVGRAQVRKFAYGKYRLDNIDASATVSKGHVLAEIDSRNPLMKGLVNVDAFTGGKQLRATVTGDIAHADLYELGLVEQPFTVAMCMHVDLLSNLKHYHQVKGTLSDITLHDKESLYRPDNVELDVLTSRDTTHAVIDCADFQLNMDARGGYELLLDRGRSFVTELENQLKNKYIDQQRLRSRLPEARVYLTSGKDNIVGRLLNHYGCQLDNVFMNMTASPVTGLNGRLRIDSLVVNGFEVDTVRFRVASDDSTMTYAAQLQNGKKNPNYIFNALFDGSINERGTYLKTRVYDWDDRLGVRLDLQGTMEQNGIRIHLFGDNPILGYKQFEVNDSNYIYMGDDRRISANMMLKAADGMGVHIFSNDSNEEALQDVTISLQRFNIGDALAMIPYTPDVTGVLNGDFHLIQTPTDLSVSSSVDVAKMVYEGSPIGRLGSEFTYMPRPDGGHYVDGILMHEGKEVGLLNGTYFSKGKGVIDAHVDLEHLPMSLVNGFIPDKLIGFKGYAEGDLAIKGSLSHPDVNGEVYLDSTYMYSEPYGVEVRFANDPVAINNSRLVFENFEVFAHNDSPLNVQGYFDFSDMERMNMNVRMRASNYLLVDAEETGRSDAYGKAYVNFYGTMSGLLNNLRMRGRLDVLGNTDLKYNLKDSPLSTDNQLEGLVEFVSFKDTVDHIIHRPPLTGFDMDLSLNIDEGAHVDCYLNADHSNYIDIVGGGEMRLQYNVVDDLRLRGRYTIGGGEMKYSLPVIPLKTFTIQDGSYIEFTGNAMNPRLNLTATEETQATVDDDSGEGRAVQFTCGVVVTKTLQDMGLEFVIDAPEDMSIHNQLQAMSKEDRGKIAVTMLTTGMYLSDGNTKGFTMNSALSAFLNSQINQISSKALRSLDVSIGVDNSINSSGALHTDYSFKFAKRFWNNRLRIVIGGKLSSGADMATDNQTFFDNVTFEYRLSATSNKYLNLFYQRDDYDWLEGNVGKFGGGFMWKRKLNHFKDIFRWGSDNPSLPVPADSVRRDTTNKLPVQR